MAVSPETWTLTLIYIDGYLLAVKDLIDDLETATATHDNAKEILVAVRTSMQETLRSCELTREGVVRLKGGVDEVPL